MPGPLATPQELNAHLQYTVPADTAALALAGASGAVRAHCGWDLTREERTFIAEGSGGVLLSLPTLHLVTVTAVRVGGVALPADGPQPIVLPRGQLLYANMWPEYTLVEVDAVHGYQVIPDLVRLVTLTIAARIVNNPEHVKTANVGTVTRTYDARMTELDIRLLDQFRI